METQEEKSSSFLKILGMGCLAVFILAGLGTWYVYKNIKNIGAEFVQKGAERLLDETLLPDEDKNQLKLVFDEVVEDFKSGEINENEFGAIVESFSESGIIPAMGLRFFEVTYLDKSNLPKQEIQEYAQILSRYRWAVIQDKIASNIARYSEIIDIITIKKAETNEFKRSLNKEELKACINIMEEVAELNNIPDQYYKINLAEEIRNVINRARDKVKTKNNNSLEVQ